MKTSQMHSLKYWASLSFLLVLLGTACRQSNKKNTATTTTKTETSTVQPPAMDIHTAVIAGNIEAVQQHIDAGTDINQKDAMSSSTPLISAASFGKIKVAKALINAGADLTSKNNDGSTALHTAAFFCRVEIVQLLMDANVDKTIRNNFGTPARESVRGRVSATHLTLPRKA